MERGREWKRSGELTTGGKRIGTNDGYEEGVDAGKRKSREERMIGEGGEAEEEGREEEERKLRGYIYRG